MVTISPERAPSISSSSAPTLDGKENRAHHPNSPTGKFLNSDRLRQTSLMSDKGSPAGSRGRLEEAAIRRRAEISSSPPIASFKQAESSSPSKRSSSSMATSLPQLPDVGKVLELARKMQLDDDSSVEQLCQKYQALNDALQESNSVQASLQKYLERSLDECERLKAYEVEAKKTQGECERLRQVESEFKKEHERLKAIEIEAKKTQAECTRLRYIEADAEKAKEESERLRPVEVEVRRLQSQLDCLKNVEEEAKKANEECKRLWAIEAEARRSQEECERLREFEVEARQSRLECERLRLVESEARSAKDECERLKDVEVEVRKLQSEVERLRAVEEGAKTLEERIEQLRDCEAEARKARSECERLQAVEAEARSSEAECKRLQTAEAEARRARDHHHHRWCVLDQEREALQRVAQQAREAEKTARASESRSLEEAAAWRRWLHSFLDVLLRRGASGFEDAEVSSSQCLAQRQPKVHLLLSQLSQAPDPPTPQPELLGQLRALYGDVSSLISSGKLTVRWGGEPDSEVSIETKHRHAESAREVELLEQKLAQKELTVAALEHDKRVLQSELRTLQNTVQELRGSIRVFCRIRPPKRQASGPLAAAGIGARAESTQHVVLKKPPGDRRHEFSFDRVFPPEAVQRNVYEEVASLLPGIFSGLHLCIFAYGQTGAGKTYTLAGDSSNAEVGLQDMAIADLLRLAEERGQMGGLHYEARLSALEIYNETVKDLLVESGSGSGSSDASRLEVRQSRDGGLGDNNASTEGHTGPSQFGSMRVPGLTTRRVHTPADVELAFKHVTQSRHVASTCLNERSSRSHCIVSLSLMQKSTGDSDGHAHSMGVLHIVDLAGSERTKVSHAEGQQMKEANAINRSLSALADVLYTLGEGGNAMHVPYRNSKLTYLLQDALGGVGCKTLLFAQVSPESPDVHETYSTLAFASRVANVQKGRLRPSSGVATPAGRRRDATSPRDTTPPPTAQRSRAGGGSFRAVPDASPLSYASDSVIDTSLLSPLPAGRSSSSGRPSNSNASPRRAAGAKVSFSRT